MVLKELCSLSESLRGAASLGAFKRQSSAAILANYGAFRSGVRGCYVCAMTEGALQWYPVTWRWSLCSQCHFVSREHKREEKEKWKKYPVNCGNCDLHAHYILLYFSLNIHVAFRCHWILWIRDLNDLNFVPMFFCFFFICRTVFTGWMSSSISDRGGIFFFHLQRDVIIYVQLRFMEIKMGDT